MPGGTGPFSLNTAELYNPATGRWCYTGSLLIRRGQETVTLLPSGQALVVGGQKRGGKILKTAESYDPATGKWNTTASLNTARSAHTATLLFDGKVLVVGGRDGTFGQLRSAELYDSEMLNPAPTAPRIIMASENARIFALLAMATCDGLISAMETKFFYNYWRPVTAIRAGDTDSNKKTDPERSMKLW